MSAEVFVARQPVFDRSKHVFGYELLYRDNGQHNAYTHRDGNRASARVMDSTLNVLGLEELTGEKHMFVNVPRQLLLNEDYLVLPPQRTVVEVLETVEPDAPVIDACRRLKGAGYMLALDDFAFRPEYRPLLEYVDVLKVDFLATDRDGRRSLGRHLEGRDICLLAEKVESQQEYDHALELGYSYFQGYFFCKPQIVSGREPEGFKRNYLRFLQEVNQPQIDYGRLEAVVKEEPGLTTRLLRYLNSAALGLRARVSSIRQALALLGDRPLRKWASLVALAGLCQDKPAEVAVTCLVRARFCESLASDVGLGDRELDLFLMGLLSGLDALMDRPLGELLAQIPVRPDVAAALLGSNTRLARVYSLVLALERGYFPRVGALARELGLAEDRVAQAYRQAVTWADQIFAG